MMGQPAPIGTGSIDVVFDEETYIDNLLAVENELQEDDEILINPLPETTVCDPENFGFSIDIGDIM